MPRRLFTLLSAVSLVLCVATCALWVRSHEVPVELTYVAGTEPGGQRQWYGVADAGTVWVRWGRFSGRDAYRPPGFYADRFFWGWYVDSAFGGAGRVLDGRQVFVRGMGEWSAPLAACAPTAGLLPAAWLVAWAKLRRRRGGVCPACGYDLRATSGRCPECGKVPSPRI